MPKKSLHDEAQPTRRRKAVYPPVETEAQFQAAVVKAAKELGWRVLHQYDSRRTEAGFPDLVMVHPRHGLALLELKRAGNAPTVAQGEWLADLATVRQVFSGWATPAEKEQIMALLTGRFDGRVLVPA